MLTVEYSDQFLRLIKKIRDQSVKDHVIKQIEKLLADPLTGKPMRYARKGTREVRVPPFRLSYAYLPDKDTIIFLDLYHKDEQ